MPVFEPNEWLFKNWTDLGVDEVHIFAEAVRHAMGKAGDLKLLNGVDWQDN